MNKKGFTLIELVAVILIIAIILLLIVPNMSNVKNNVQTKLWLENEGRLVEATKKYMYSKDINYPDVSGESIIIEKSELLDEKLISEIYDFANKDEICDAEVIITNIANKYIYSPYIHCANSYVSKTVIENGLIFDLPLGNQIIGSNYTDRSNNTFAATNNGTTLSQNRFLDNNKSSLFSIGTSVNCAAIGNPNAYTVSVWVNPNLLTGIGEYSSFGYTIAATSSAYGMWLLLTAGEIRLFAFTNDTGGSYVTSGLGMQINNWYNVTVTAAQGGIAKIYLNGQEKLSFPASNQSWAGSLTLGDLRPGRGINFSGMIDDIKIYNRVLSPEEINHNYNIEKYTSI